MTAKRAKTPAELHSHFLQAINAGDLDGLLALYREDSYFLPSDGGEAHGCKQIRAAFCMLVALRPTVQFSTRRIVDNGDFALLSADWIMRATGPDGSPIEMAGRSMEVARRDPEGNWYYLIDDPTGGE